MGSPASQRSRPIKGTAVERLQCAFTMPQRFGPCGVVRHLCAEVAPQMQRLPEWRAHVSGVLAGVTDDGDDWR